MLLELVVALALVAGLLAMVFTLVAPVDGALALQWQTADLYQRQRTVLALLHRELLEAGSGPSPEGAARLAHLRPPVTPALTGAHPGPVGDDRLTVLSARSGPGARLAGVLSGRRGHVALVPAAGCHRLPCGLTAGAGGLVVVHDAAGWSDLYRLDRLSGAVASVEALGPGVPAVYGAGSWMLPVRVRGYHLDRHAGELRVYDGASTDRAVVDGVVRFTVEYFGDARPARPRPTVPAGAPRPAPCLDSGDAGPPPGVAPPPAVLPVARLGDGPWCDRAAWVDVDLFRVRRVRVTVGLRVADEAWRRPDGPVVAHPGRTGAVGDLVATVDVAPRSLLAW